MEVFKGVVRRMTTTEMTAKPPRTGKNKRKPQKPVVFHRYLVMGLIVTTEEIPEFKPVKEGGQATDAGDTLLAGESSAESLMHSAGLAELLNAIKHGKFKREPTGLSADQILTGLDQI